MQLPDGTYLASEFNYSLPRHHKGYNTVGYKNHTRGGDGQRDHSYLTNVRINRENDRGYYSGHTYESPVCEHAEGAKRGSGGYHKANTEENGAKLALFHNSGNENSNLQPSSRTLAFSKAVKPDDMDVDLAT